LFGCYFVLFYVLFVCKCVLPPGDNPTAIINISYHISQYIVIKFKQKSSVACIIIMRMKL